MSLRPAIALVALLVGSAALTACGASTDAGAMIPAVTMTAKDFAFEMPQQVTGGLVAITLQNQGQEPHQAQLARLHDGVTRQQVEDALAQGPEAALPLVSLVGGPNTVEAGKSQTVIVDLPAGEYLALCFVSSSDGHSHIEKGMTASFTATAPDARPAEPTADGLVTLRDFSFELPAPVAAGPVTWKVWNNGGQPHELTLVKLAEGKTQQDAMAYLRQPEGPPPFTGAGGMVALDPEKSGWVKLTLEPGTYMAMCFVPDPSTHAAHAEMGMTSAFTVR